jgi:hypothetical protein
VLALGQGVELSGSQASPPVTTPSPHCVGQSLSVLAFPPFGQHPSSDIGCVICPIVHFAVHPSPEKIAFVQPEERQLLGLGQTVVLIGSQVSLPVTTPSPQRVAQSLSLLALAPSGQQPSPDCGIVIALQSHLAVQLAASPLNDAAMQPAERQLVGLGQAVVLIGSHASFPVTTPSPQRVAQSLSLLALALSGQQWSPFIGAVIGVFVQTTLHCWGLPVSTSVVHAFLSSHDAWHGCVVLDGSHVSFVFTTPSPQLWEQSMSEP